MDQSKTGKFIAEKRKEQGFLQKDIALRLGVSEKTVSKWECGNGLPEVVFMEPLCKILGITVNELLSAFMLANIHVSMRDMKDLPVGIGADFLKYRRPEYMEESYEKTCRQAIENGNEAIAERIRTNMRIVRRMPDYKFDIRRFSCGNTHGDYMISQLIFKDGKIAGVIDWTCACIHPYIWEIVRSYVFMAPEIKHGEINMESLCSYISDYLKYGTLNTYDIENAGKFFYYFLSVCNFYGQYYDSLSKNRNIYLKQADIASSLLEWFESHMEELSVKLEELARQEEYQKK